MTFEEYLIRAARRKSLHHSERMGQAYYNQLREDRPLLAESVLGMEIDPFYKDDRIGEFLSYVCVMWEVT